MKVENKENNRKIQQVAATMAITYRDLVERTAKGRATAGKKTMIPKTSPNF